MEFTFNNADHAVKWATEVLRRGRFPKLSSIYGEAVDDPLDILLQHEDITVQNWISRRSNLPTNKEDRHLLAMEVYKHVHKLSPDQVTLLTLYYWGDYASEKRLQVMLQMQEKLRMQGKKVRLNYRYSFRQVGIALDIDHKTAAKRVRTALNDLHTTLVEHNLVEDVCCDMPVPDADIKIIGMAS